MVQPMKARFHTIRILTSVLAIALLTLITGLLFLLGIIHWYLFQVESRNIWHPFPPGTSKQTLMVRFGLPSREVRVENDPLGVQEVLMFDSPLEISVYIDQKGRMMAARRSIPTILRGWGIDEVLTLVFFTIVALTILLCSPMPSPHVRILGLISLAFILIIVSGEIHAMYPLAAWMPLAWLLLLGLGGLLLVSAVIYGVYASASVVCSRVGQSSASEWEGEY
ncbi:MAG: hypothetical protein ABDI19_10270 [Armatimonadota bacterium]